MRSDQLKAYTSEQEGGKWERRLSWLLMGGRQGLVWVKEDELKKVEVFEGSVCICVRPMRTLHCKYEQKFIRKLSNALWARVTAYSCADDDSVCMWRFVPQCCRRGSLCFLCGEARRIYGVDDRSDKKQSVVRLEEKDEFGFGVCWKSCQARQADQARQGTWGVEEWKTRKKGLTELTTVS